MTSLLHKCPILVFAGVMLAGCNTFSSAPAFSGDADVADVDWTPGPMRYPEFNPTDLAATLEVCAGGTIPVIDSPRIPADVSFQTVIRAATSEGGADENFVVAQVDADNRLQVHVLDLEQAWTAERIFHSDFEVIQTLGPSDVAGWALENQFMAGVVTTEGRVALVQCSFAEQPSCRGEVTDVSGAHVAIGHRSSRFRAFVVGDADSSNGIRDFRVTTDNGLGLDSSDMVPFDRGRSISYVAFGEVAGRNSVTFVSGGDDYEIRLFDTAGEWVGPTTDSPPNVNIGEPRAEYTGSWEQVWLAYDDMSDTVVAPIVWRGGTDFEYIGMPQATEVDDFDVALLPSGILTAELSDNQRLTIGAGTPDGEPVLSDITDVDSLVPPMRIGVAAATVALTDYGSGTSRIVPLCPEQ